MTEAPAGTDPVVDAWLAAALFAIDPHGSGGVWLRAPPGPLRDAWLACLRRLLPQGAPIRRVPPQIADEHLLGGLDLAATLHAGRPVARPGLLGECDGGVALLAMAERLPACTAARLVMVQDAGAVAPERDGVAQCHPARFAMVALDEGITGDERPPAALLDRLALHLDLSACSPRALPGLAGSLSWLEPDAGPAADPDSVRAVAAARALLPAVRGTDALLEALCGSALALGIASIRAPLLALRVARAAAALAGRAEVAREDAAIAARLVLAPRATVLPYDPEAPAPDPPSDPPPSDPAPSDAPPSDLSRSDAPPSDPPPASGAADTALGDLVLAAARAAMPPALLDQLRLAAIRPHGPHSSGRAGQSQPTRLHGRPIGARPGRPGSGQRLHVVETLKAAAPWQRLRAGAPAPGRLAIRRDDFRVTVFRQRRGTTTIFAVDASGSAAFQRLAEAKGAVEQLLADCYVRRDKVALLAFRGARAELLLPATNALARARRSLAGLPGGGGTPLAAGIDAARAQAEAAGRAGQTPIVVLLTDGHANVGLNGLGGRPQAGADALAAAARLRAAAATTLLVDISPRPQALAARLAEALAARYLPLPLADAATLSRAVRAAAGAAR
jgi:magnesium chelatase subunit D